jgi:hypothetical protein
MMMVWRTEQPPHIDLDQSGRVDILDAFAMARLIRDGGSGAPDVNRDGRLDHLDIDLVAGEAVML